MKITLYGIKTKHGVYRLDNGSFCDEDLNYVLEHAEKSGGHIVWQEITEDKETDMYKVTLVMAEGGDIVYGAKKLAEVTEDIKVIEAALASNRLVYSLDVAEYPFWFNPKYLVKVEVAEGLD